MDLSEYKAIYYDIETKELVRVRHVGFREHIVLYPMTGEKERLKTSQLQKRFRSYKKNKAVRALNFKKLSCVS